MGYFFFFLYEFEKTQIGFFFFYLGVLYYKAKRLVFFFFVEKWRVKGSIVMVGLHC